jgi:protease I
MARIAVIITGLFEDSEYVKPVQAYKESGHEIINIGLEAGVTVYGKKEKTPVVIDQAVSEVRVDSFDVLFIPGGYSPDKLRVDEKAVDFARKFMESGKPVFSICHGPQLLITADVLRGRTLTGWKSIHQDIFNAGAVFLDREVVEDGNLISSRSPADLAGFIKATVVRLALIPG